MIFDAPNRNRLWADLLVEELVRCGVTFFCMAPGSRSTPLVTAVAAHPKARQMVHFDERGTAFFALGHARATGCPAAWITTSGTALANGFPAIVEAATDGVPMLLLTADRPPELRDTRANQTIDQVKLFGEYVRWAFDLPAPDGAVDPAMVLTTIDQAVYRATAPPPGPVHLNCMFREPLAPDPGGEDLRTDVLRPWFERGKPQTTYVARRALPAGDTLSDLRAAVDAARGLVVAGRLDTPSEAEAVLHLAGALGWPLLADIGSQLRLGTEAGGDVRIDHYDLLLHSPGFRVAHHPDVVLYFGRSATSKRLMQFLEAHRPGVFAVIRNDPFRFDPTHQVTHRVEADVAACCRVFLDGPPPVAAPAGWLEAWRSASDRLEAVLSQEGRDGELLEPRLARALSTALPEDHGLFLASSMPVRDMDAFGSGRSARVRVASNRGASGIDGTVASAAGFAGGLAQPVTLVIGDLALLHDLNSLALVRGRPVVIVALNNDGGGIFHFLPIARHADVFEPFFGTPHGRTFEAAARMFDLAYAAPGSVSAFVKAYRAACARGGPALIEVRTDRHRNRAFHRRIQEDVGRLFG